MELRVLEYFLAVAREQSISGAAEVLHLSQPTLSRQLKDLEEELGKQLFIRGSRRISLTEEGMILRKRSEEILNLVQKTENEITLSDDVVAGDIYIGAGETEAVRLIAQAAKSLQAEYPDIHYHISSGDTLDVTDALDKGLIDFGLLFGEIDNTKYNSMPLPLKDTYGILMRPDSPLASKDFISPEDLWDKPLMLNRNSKNGGMLSQWLQRDISDLNIISTYTLVYNASLMVEEGLGYSFSLEKLINPSSERNLCFRPLSPTLQAGTTLIWKKYQIFSKASEKLLLKLKEIIAENEGP